MASEAENDCPICRDTLHGNLSVGCTVPCGHLFHRRCFETWQVHSTSKRCPCCNANLTGFIDKIHITLPASSSNSLEPELQLSRRKALSNEKAKRSAMMRHKDRRNQSAPTMNNINGRDEVEVNWQDRPASRAKSVSLSASLQRIPSDPVKEAAFNGTEMRECPTSFPGHESYEIVSVHSLRLNDDLYAGVEHLEDQIPNVADKIMANIERTLRQPPSSTHKPSNTHHNRARRNIPIVGK